MLYTPNLEKLKLSQKYGLINIVENTTENLFIKLYDGELETQDVIGDLNLEMKYSKAEIGDVEKGQVVLLDSKFYSGNIGSLILDTKYSKVKLGDVGMLELNAHDDKFELSSLGMFAIRDKYSDFIISDFGSGRMDVHDSSFTIGKGGNLKMKSKYSNIKIDQLNDLNIELSYDDNLDINTLESFSCGVEIHGFQDR